MHNAKCVESTEAVLNSLTGTDRPAAPKKVLDIRWLEDIEKKGEIIERRACQRRS